jgi:predicted ester cyclase
MSAEENKALVRRYLEEFNKHNVASLEEFWAPDFVFHGPGVVGDMDLAGAKQIGPAFLTAFPDAHWAMDDLIAEGDKVAYRCTFRGTHQGEFMGIAPTGKVMTYTCNYIDRFAGSKVVEEWGSLDMLGLMQQLGAIPQMAQTGP